MRIPRHLQRKLPGTKLRCPRGLFSRGSRLLFHLSIGLASLSRASVWSQTLYVVERERGALAIVKDGKWGGEIPGLGDTSHTTVKFSRGDGFSISRDGYVSKIDPKTHKVVRKVKVGNSGIGLDFVRDYVAVANYDPGTVVILDRDLNLRKTVETGSRNVGIKALDNKLAFALMEKDEVWVLDADNGFSILKNFTAVGKLPFDALLADRRYVVGFFNDTRLGIVNLDNLEFKAMSLDQGNEETVLKIPHFGLWGIAGNTVYIPANKDKKLHALSLPGFDYLGAIDLIGTPVFVAASPDGKTVAVNYSGEKEDFLTIVDTLAKRVDHDIEAGKRIMHLRFSPSGEKLYFSSYFENQLKTLAVGSWKPLASVDVPTPSGIFVVP